MYKKILITSCISLLSLVTASQGFALSSCKIESGPILELVGYMRSVDTKLATLRAEGSNRANCGNPTGGVMKSTDRTISVIDRAFLEVPIFDNTFLDFAYNIRLAANGETRAPVTRDGLLFNQVEKKITNTLASVTNQCNLSDSVKAGFTILLQENQTLENIFKQAALGTPVSPTGLSTENILVANAINIGYIPTSTESCKDQNGTQDSIAKIMTSIEGIGAKNEGGLSEWRKAIALFQGLGNRASSPEKSAAQRRLLQGELSRQGFSPRMAQTILGNFDCFKKEVKNDSAEEAIRARVACMKNPILGLENITLLPQRKAVDIAKTTDDRVYKVNQLSDKKRIVTDIEYTYRQLEPMKTPAIEIKSTLMSNLIDIHLGLLSTAEIVEKRIPIMYANCMKAQPSVSCPKP